MPFGRYLFWVTSCYQSVKPNREGVEELPLCCQLDKPQEGASVEELPMGTPVRHFPDSQFLGAQSVVCGTIPRQGLSGCLIETAEQKPGCQRGSVVNSVPLCSLAQFLLEFLPRPPSVIDSTWTCKLHEAFSPQVALVMVFITGIDSRLEQHPSCCSAVITFVSPFPPLPMSLNAHNH